MFEKVEEYKAMIQAAEVKAAEELEQFRMKFISKKSVVTELFNDFKNVPNEQKKAFGQALNELKDLAQEKFQALADALSDQSSTTADIGLDMTLPNVPGETGSIHPLTITTNKIIEIFERMGFNVERGPEIEEDFYNFTALNFPENHPAREMQDTFFIEKNPDKVLRTHTSNVQIRLMEGQKPPFRSIMPGRVFRNEAISARAHCFFHQVEGLYVNKNVGFKDLKDTVYHFVKELFGPETKIRFRPSYFPFTEPSAEIDISCFICHGKGCNVCKHTNWVEIGGSGMVDPNVLANCGIDPEEYTGFAFGMGIERITMLKYQINDLRLFSENDVRFLNQFKGTF
ncbi:phenylalanine--tRNA ligase subunit alpha [Reichenbachiella agarivorans]|uniref:Phenylalanine--tRNA ligase alpha subunit n=1 Tax=Reichenbachiella agarivorans TaxID=2979464 RepID=A0ABY6CT77_9BACT|nr:phenylalanine--tRNA ligase subunit alpha [Reichenbachiella agarivorans]UXP33544.1 phenylalanine--tRNA ligase subunit alpha [Reichenbachiella agarivorans]